MKKRFMAALLAVGMMTTIFTGCDEEKKSEGKNVLKTLAEYEGLVVYESDVAITDDEIEAQLEAATSAFSTTEQVTEGKVKDGDVLNIDYEGTLVGETEPFDGGTAEGATLTIGSGSFIDDFEEQLIGVKIGNTKEIVVTFPDEYSNNPDLAGKDAKFVVTVNYKSVTTTPELTDDFVKENYGYSEATTVEEFKEYVKERLYYNKVLTAIWTDYVEECEVESYDQTELEEKKTLINDNYENYIYNTYGADLTTYLSAVGQTEQEWDDMITENAESSMKEQMIIEAIAKELKMSIDDEEYKEQAAIYATQNTYDSVEALESAYGKSEIEYSITYNKVTEYIVDKAVVEKDPETTTAAETETTAEATEETETAE